MKTSFFAFGILFFSLLISNCTKKNTDSILLLGSESNVLSLNDVYPPKYQAEMKDILEGTVDIPNGISPPNLVGNFHIDGALINGNEKYINFSGDTVSLQNYKLNDSTYMNYYKLDANRNMHNFDLKVISQHNATAKIEWIIYNKLGNVVSDTIIDEAYIRGKNNDANRGGFALYFNTEGRVSGLLYLDTYLITGTIYRKNDDNSDHEKDGIENVQVWKLVKSYLSPTHVYLVGGARLYFDENEFSESID